MSFFEPKNLEPVKAPTSSFLSNGETTPQVADDSYSNIPLSGSNAKMVIQASIDRLKRAPLSEFMQTDPSREVPLETLEVLEAQQERLQRKPSNRGLRTRYASR
jgi:hypothetical protein